MGIINDVHLYILSSHELHTGREIYIEDSYCHIVYLQTKFK